MKLFFIIALASVASLASAQRGVVRVRGRPRKIDVVAAPLPVAAAAPPAAVASDLGCPEPFGLQEIIEKFIHLKYRDRLKRGP